MSEHDNSNTVSNLTVYSIYEVPIGNISFIQQ